MTFELYFKNNFSNPFLRQKNWNGKKLLQNLALFCTFMYLSNFLCSECDPGNFGLMCKDECSFHCLDPLSCDHVTGSCDGGCEDGWIGSRCTEGQ